jgi:hypothetical protein
MRGAPEEELEQVLLSSLDGLGWKAEARGAPSGQVIAVSAAAAAPLLTSR